MSTASPLNGGGDDGVVDVALPDPVGVDPVVGGSKGLALEVLVVMVDPSTVVVLPVRVTVDAVVASGTKRLVLEVLIVTVDCLTGVVLPDVFAEGAETLLCAIAVVLATVVPASPKQFLPTGQQPSGTQTKPEGQDLPLPSLQQMKPTRMHESSQARRPLLEQFSWRRMRCFGVTSARVREGRRGRRIGTTGFSNIATVYCTNFYAGLAGF